MDRESALNNLKLLIFSFFTPVLLLSVVLAAIGVYPAGDNTVVIVDSFHQYTPFLMEFGRMLRRGSNFLYSWNAGLGSNFLARYAYYLSSPLNFFAVFFKDKVYAEFVLGLVLFRVGISGMTFFIYLREKFRTVDIKTLAFSVMYALCGFFLAYYWNIMWFDCVAVFPLLALGLERLVDEGKGLLYCVTLAFTIMTNYFVALLICVYLVLYCIIYYLSHNTLSAASGGGIKKMLKVGARFSLYSLIAGAISSVLIIPAFLGFLSSSAAGATFPKKLEIYSDLLDILANHLALIEPTVMTGLPNVYCGIAVLFLVPFYFLNRKIDLREKLCNGFLICFFLISFNMNYLDFLWHGTHFPNSLPFRFSFLYVLLLLTISYKALIHFDGVYKRDILSCGVLLTGFIFLMEMLKDNDNMVKLTVYISFLYVLIHLAILYIMKSADDSLAYQKQLAGEYNASDVYDSTESSIRIRNRFHAENRKRGGEIAFFIFVCLEIAVSSGFGIAHVGFFTKNNYITHMDEVMPAVEKVKSWEKGFERMEFTTQTGYNTPVVYDFKGVSHYSSTAQVKVNDLFGKLGFIHSNAWYVYRSSTPFVNSILSIKYLLDKESDFDNMMYPLVEQIDEVRIYENPYFLPVGFMVREDVEAWELTQMNPFSVQDDFARRATGLDGSMFQRLEITEENMSNIALTSRNNGMYNYICSNPGQSMEAVFSVRADRDMPVYFFVRSAKVFEVTIEKGLEFKEEHNVRYPNIMDAQRIRAGEEAIITLTIEDGNSGDFTVYAYTVDEPNFQKVYEKLNSQGLLVTEYTDTSLEGNVDVLEDGILFLSIPYDDGWTVKVDGNIVEKETIGDGALMAIRLDRGYHEVSMRYRTSGLIPGVCITAAAALLLVAIEIIKRRWRLQQNDEIQSIVCEPFH